MVRFAVLFSAGKLLANKVPIIFCRDGAGLHCFLCVTICSPATLFGQRVFTAHLDPKILAKDVRGMEVGVCIGSALQVYRVVVLQNPHREAFGRTSDRHRHLYWSCDNSIRKRGGREWYDVLRGIDQISKANFPAEHEAPLSDWLLSNGEGQSSLCRRFSACHDSRSMVIFCGDDSSLKSSDAPNIA